MEFYNQMKVLIQLSLVDNQLSSFEKRAIYALGKANNLAEREIDKLFDELLRIKVHELPEVLRFDDDEKFDCLYNIIQLMKVDKRVYLSEIKFCEALASKLGYKKKVIRALSGHIFSDPSMTSDRDTLKKMSENYKLSS